MDRDYALLCWSACHSKILTPRSLAASAEPCFRGEAFPSIASVLAVFRLNHAASCGVAPGRNPSWGAAIEKRSLRRKSLLGPRSKWLDFSTIPLAAEILHSENTGAYIEHQLIFIRRGIPELASFFVRDERVVFQLPAASSLGRTQIRDLMARNGGATPHRGPNRRSRESGSRLIGRPAFSRPEPVNNVPLGTDAPIEVRLLHRRRPEGYHTAPLKAVSGHLFSFSISTRRSLTT